MKKLLPLILVFMLILSGCFTSANSSTEIEVNGHDYEFVNDTIYLLYWETVTYPDGTVHKAEFDPSDFTSGKLYVNGEETQQLTREYNAYGDLVLESNGAYTTRYEYTYDENRKILRQEEYLNDQLNWIYEFTYNDQGHRTKMTGFNSDGIEQGCEEFERNGSYEAGKRYLADGTYAGYTQYTYAYNDKIAKEEIYDLNDVLCETVIRNYISTGMQTLIVDGIPASVHFRIWYWDDVNRIILTNMHNGGKTEITGETSVREITDYMKTINGGSGESGKGYSEGSYTLDFYQDEELIRSVGFGDSASIYTGVAPDGYPCRYALYSVTIEEVITFLSKFDESNFDWNTQNP